MKLTEVTLENSKNQISGTSLQWRANSESMRQELLEKREFRVFQRQDLNKNM